MQDISIVKLAAQPVLKILKEQNFGISIFAFSFPIMTKEYKTLFVTIAGRYSIKKKKYIFDLLYQNDLGEKPIPITFNDAV